MNNISQTKEGFIRSMILFVVLLGLCFAPFFAFSQNAVQNDEQKVKSSIEKTTAFKAVVSNELVSLEAKKENHVLSLSFKTEFNCVSYVLEARHSNDQVFEEVSYCNNQNCVNANEGVSYRLMGPEASYSEYRVKTISQDGTVYFSPSLNNQVQKVSEIELINTAASDQLFLKFNAENVFHYSISSINGEVIKIDEPVSANSISLSGLEAGFYIISFKGLDGNACHYKFFKTINL